MLNIPLGVAPHLRAADGQNSIGVASGANGFKSSRFPVASVTIPAGTDAPLVNDNRRVQPPSEVGLWYGSWYVAAVTTVGVDTWAI